MKDDISARLARLLAEFPAEEMKKNGAAVAAAILSRLNVVGREEFDVHCEMLSRAVIRLRALESQIARLEEAAANSAKKHQKPRK